MMKEMHSNSQDSLLLEVKNRKKVVAAKDDEYATLEKENDAQWAIIKKIQAAQAAHAQDLANTKKWSLGHLGSIDKNSKNIDGIWSDNKKMSSDISQLYGNDKSATALEAMRA